MNSLDGAAGKRLSRSVAWSVYLGLGLATLALFWRVTGFPFVQFDDGEYVADNEFLKLKFIPHGVAWAFTTFRGANWHPLTWLSHMLDFKLFGLDSGRHHLVNVVLHTANSLLLLRVLASLTGAFWRSVLVAALFALHPLHVESVAWVSERKDVLSTLFWILTMGAYVRYVARRSADRYLVMIVLFLLGLLSKPTLITLPLVLLLLDFWPLGRLRLGSGGVAVSDVVKEKMPLFALAALTVGFTLYAPAHLQALASLNTVSLGERIGNGLISYVQYLQLTVWPAGLAALYPYPETLLRGRVILSLVALATFSALAAMTIRDRPALAAGWLWYVLVLLPMIGVVQVGPQVMADRYTYVALVGIFIAAVWGLPPPRRGRPLRSLLWTLAVAVALCGCFLVSWRQVGWWRDSRSLFQRAVDVTPDNNYYARVFLGRALAAENRFTEALVHIKRAVVISPAFPLAHLEMGITLARMERWGESLAGFREAVRLDPGSAAAHHGLASALIRLGQVEEGIAHYLAAMRLNPQEQVAHLETARIIKDGKGAGAARDFFVKLLELNPDSGRAQFGLGLSLAGEGRIQEATAHFSRAVELMPDSAAAQFNLAKAYDLAGQPERALEHYRRAVAIDPGIEQR